MTLTVRSQSRAPGVAPVLGRARFRFASRLRQRVAVAWRELARGRALPAAVSAGLAFERAERVLSVGRDRDGQCALLATDRALYRRALRCEADAGGWSRIGWEQVAQVGWDAAAGQLVIIGLVGGVGGGVGGAAPPRMIVPLRHRGAIPELAQERVTHTKLGQWQLLIAGTHRVLVEARRRPVTGELAWFAAPSGNGHGSGSGSGEREIGAHVERAIARLRADLGVTPRSGTGLPFSGSRQLR